MANVPSTEWDSLIDCLEDWIDEGDVHGLNGAESDDAYYEEQGNKIKNERFNDYIPCLSSFSLLIALILVFVNLGDMQSL